MSLIDYFYICLAAGLVYCLWGIWTRSNDLIETNYKLREELDLKIVSLMHYKKENARLQEIIRKMSKLSMMEENELGAALERRQNELNASALRQSQPYPKGLHE